jgi:hypothetical protein
MGITGGFNIYPGEKDTLIPRKLLLCYVNVKQFDKDVPDPLGVFWG